MNLESPPLTPEPSPSDRPRAAPSLRFVVLALALAVFALSFYFTRDRGRAEEMRHLGAEYFNVARALVDGRGYADPFAEATGPTAWMPPLYTLVLAGLLAALQSKNAVAIAVIVLQNVALVGIGTGIYCVVRRAAPRVSAWVPVVAYVSWLALFNYWFFILTTDIWVIGGLATLMMLMVTKWLGQGTLRPWSWGLMSGVATLVSPVLAVAWSSFALLVFVRNVRAWRAWAAAGAVAAAIALPWSLRNAVTFGKFIPTKSNLGYELYLANVVDDDGIYDNASMLRHPYHVPQERFDYARLGEIGYVAQSMQRFRDALELEPAAYLSRIGHRLLAVTLWYPFSERELSGPLQRVGQRILYALPLALWVSTIWGRGRSRPLLLFLPLLVVLALAPYVMIAFYARYVFPLTPLLVVIGCLGLDVWLERFASRAKITAPSEPHRPAA